METAYISDPPIFNCKLKVMFFPIWIYHVHFEAPFYNKGVVFTHISFLKNELPAFNFSLFENFFYYRFFSLI